MKGVVIVGGMGTRLAPLTNVLNKHLLPVGPMPMFAWPLCAMAEVNVREIMVVCGGNMPGAFMEMAGDGRDLDLRLAYAYQAAPRGSADALRLARDFASNGDCLLMLGDTILGSSLADWACAFDAQDYGARMLLQEVPDPERCAVVKWGEAGDVLDLIEKPAHPPSSHAVLGAYCFDHTVWSRLDDLRPDSAGQYQVTDLLRSYLGDNALAHDVYEGRYADAGTWAGYRAANEIGWEKMVTWPAYS